MAQQYIFDKLSAFLRKVYADIKTGPILDMEQYFPEHKDLDADFDAIRAEVLKIFEDNPNVPRFHDVVSSQERISANDGKNWRIFLVKSYGRFIGKNAEKTPVLTKFLQANPQVTTCNLSYLDPGKHIPAHLGPFRGILRYHICLFAPDADPETGPWLKVDGEQIHYAERGALLWDDTYMHEVLNPGPNPRVAILLDIKRPVKRLMHRFLFRTVLIGGYLFTWANEKKMRVGD